MIFSRTRSSSRVGAERGGIHPALLVALLLVTGWGLVAGAAYLWGGVIPLLLALAAGCFAIALVILRGLTK